MREILFRGKQADNGEWVYGYYTELPVGSIGATIFSNDDEIVCEDTASYIIKVFEKQHSNYSNGNPLQVIECENYEVIPETVGQYTGLTDKNGTKIFEGDIVILRFNKWDTDNACYALYQNVITKVSGFNADTMKLFEVIGNIHDDSDLFGGIKMNEKELKPCPFCGNEFPTINYHKSTNTYYVACPYCQSVFGLDCTAGHYSDKNKTVEAWNRRADNGK